MYLKDEEVSQTTLEETLNFCKLIQTVTRSSTYHLIEAGSACRKSAVRASWLMSQRIEVAASLWNRMLLSLSWYPRENRTKVNPLEQVLVIYTNSMWTEKKRVITFSRVSSVWLYDPILINTQSRLHNVDIRVTLGYVRFTTDTPFVRLYSCILACVVSYEQPLYNITFE